MEYDQAARKRLGRAVRAARRDAGFVNREDFAEKVGRSARQVQALENGESGVGVDTWSAAAKVLEWPIEKVYEILDGRRETDRSPSTALTSVSDDELVDELRRRLNKKAGEGDDRDAPSTSNVTDVSEGRPNLRRVARKKPGQQ